MFWLYNRYDKPRADLGFIDVTRPVVGERKVSRKVVDKRRERNALAKKARKAQRNKGLGKVKTSWSPGPNGRGLITEHQPRNK